MTPDPYLMTSVDPEDTGLPYFVWIAISAGDVQEPRIYISRRMAATLDDLIEVLIEPEVHVVGDVQIGQDELDLLGRWIELNRDAIIRHWSGESSSLGMISEIRSITGSDDL